jgi:D-arginine dehydrogenase
LQARQLVNAAGAWADRVAEQCGWRASACNPADAARSPSQARRSTTFARWPAVIGVDESFYFKPDAGQLLGSPANADPVEPQDAAPEELDLAWASYNIEAITTLEIRRPSHSWAGLRSFVADGDLVIGFDAQQPAFFWLAAQGGYGIQSAAGASRLAADLLQGLPLCSSLTQQGVEPARLSPARFNSTSKGDCHEQ